MPGITFTTDGSDSNFFIFVVESPFESEVRSSTSEGKAIAQVLALSGVPTQVLAVADAEELERCIRIDFVRAGMHQHNGRVPVLHLSAHGDLDGLKLRNGAVPWSHVANWMSDVNWEYFGTVLASISACRGLQGYQGALGRHPERLPFMTLVGSTAEPRWGQSAAAFVALYTQLAYGSSIRTAVEAMRWASRHAEWDFVLGDELVALGNSIDLTLGEILVGCATFFL